MGQSCSSSRPDVVLSKPSKLVELLGDTLVTSSGTVSTASALADKSAICIYFSAHWCPPCRGFTPMLSNAYTEHLKAKGVEVVFVSSDRDEAAFKSYFGEMPWLALPFADRKVKAKLSETFRVSGIPKLVVLGGDGKLLTDDGRSRVMRDPTGSSWVPARKVVSKEVAEPASKEVASASGSLRARADGLSALLGAEPLLDIDGKTSIDLASVVKDAPLVALYFSAHWCGPCRHFTPKLVAFVNELAGQGSRLPVIFGSSDHDSTAFDEYFASMPWYAFPHADARINALKAKFGADGVPWLVVLDARTGQLIVNEADTEVDQGPQAYQRWLKLARKDPEAAPAA